MNCFIAAHFPKPGKFGFPKEYSEKWRKDWSSYVTAYTDHLRKKGWLDMAYSYNIDEPKKTMWEQCKQNALLSRAAAKDLRVWQCTNIPAGTTILKDYTDTFIVNLLQYHKAKIAIRQSEGKEVMWAICCWPSGHPNLFIDYPAMDARIIGFMTWKFGVSGFEYWQVCKTSGKAVKNVESPSLRSSWNPMLFGKYNGDGYLIYPGKDLKPLSSVRFENLRDGFEDYEYLAILRDRVARAKEAGRSVAEAEKLLTVSDTVCRMDFSFTSDPATIQTTRKAIAEAIEELR
jgi:hypothetical protein